MGSKRGSDWDSSSRMGGDAAVPMEKLVAAQVSVNTLPYPTQPASSRRARGKGVP